MVQELLYCILFLFFCLLLSCQKDQFSPPQNVKVSQGDFTDHITVSWDAVSRASVYSVYRSNETAASLVEIYHGEFTEYDDYLLDTKTNFYSITAARDRDRSDGESEKSEAVMGYAE